MTKGQLIGIVGYKGAGKSDLSRGARFRITAHDVLQIGFSDPMIDMMLALGVSKGVMFDKTQWNEPQPVLQGRSLRYAMQTLGTEWGRDHIHADLWTGIGIARAAEHRRLGQSVVIDNVRFPSEFAAMRHAGAHMIALVRSGLDPDLSHSSEQHIALLQHNCDITVYNNGSFEQGVELMRRTICELIGIE